MKVAQILYFSILSLALVSVGCGKDSSFSLLDDQDTFQQSDSTVNSKVDILWVIDNSGSMETSQNNVISNLNSFIQDFSSKNLDFKMAVTTTDAYRVQYTGNSNCSKFRDGIRNSSCNTVNGRPYSGIPVMDSLTANLQSVFLINASLTDSNANIYGSGDERAFQSMKAALDENLNSGFLRTDSFLSVIIVSDEEDFSQNGSSLNENYNNPGLHTVQSYVNYLDNLTSSTPTNRRYNVNAMAIFDETCRASLNSTFTGRKIGLRYASLVDSVNTAHPSSETQGLKTSLCGNFAQDLNLIASNILTLANRFSLNRLPIPETIAVIVNGVSVPHKDSNPSNDGGWIYEASTNSILFIGNGYIPPSGASIRVTYDPVGYGV
ncbi:MAG: hypothetical protein KDD38_11525 [Bdellovibrionales bacterium]|nr:hypothetical protein [Bdellovibrionales bacterium]